MKALLPLLLFLAPALAEVKFEKRILTEYYFCDGINYGDFDGDGDTDIVAGPFWYAGPEFTKAHVIYEPVPLPPALSPSDSMFSYVHDFNADGHPDVLRLGRVHKHEACWFENPGPQATPGPWKRHFIADRVKGESPPFADVDDDGRPELVTHWETHWGLLKPDPSDPAKPWIKVPITRAGKWEQFYHGTGLGDVNLDGRIDLVLDEGWWEQPEKPGAEWIEHPYKFGAKGGAQMGVFDVDGDGDQDIVSAIDAHGWGVAWFENVGLDKPFVKHLIMGTREELPTYGVAFTQPHAFAFADMDGDGLTDIVTGKRRWAHGPEGDIEPGAEPVLYWFQLVRDAKGARFVPHLIDNQSGVGVHVIAADVNRDQQMDVLTVSKLGTFVFLRK